MAKGKKVNLSSTKKSFYSKSTEAEDISDTHTKKKDEIVKSEECVKKDGKCEKSDNPNEINIKNNNELKNEETENKIITGKNVNKNEIKIVENYFKADENIKIDENLQKFEENLEKLFLFIKSKYQGFSDTVKKNIFDTLITPLIDTVGKKGLKIILTLFSSATQKNFLLLTFHHFIPYRACRFFYIILNGFWSYRMSKKNIQKISSIVLAYLDYINYFN